jgi:hypothetical protein
VGFVSRKVNWCRVSFENFGFLLPITVPSIPHIMSTVAGTIGPSNAAVPVDSASIHCYN